MSKSVDRFLYRLTAGLPARLINIDGRPYLERYFVARILGVTVYLHRFVSPDRERHLHNHPWGWGRAVVLSGGYDEEVVTDLCPAVGPSGCVTETRRIRWYNRVDGAHFHRIANAERGTWTLFMHGPRSRIQLGMASVSKGWGFLERADNATVFKPYKSARSEWWKTAPKGRDSDRVGLQ